MKPHYILFIAIGMILMNVLLEIFAPKIVTYYFTLGLILAWQHAAIRAYPETEKSNPSETDSKCDICGKVVNWSDRSIKVYLDTNGDIKCIDYCNNPSCEQIAELKVLNMK